MNENMMNRSYEVQVEGDSLGRYTAKTFGWMFAGLPSLYRLIPKLEGLVEYDGYKSLLLPAWLYGYAL